MSDLSLTILAETAGDAQAIDRLHERTFGPGRFVLSAYRLREHVDHLLDLSFTARIGTLLVGSVRQLPVLIGDSRALLLGPLTVEPPFRGRGVGRALLDRALKDARAKGHRLVLLVGDEAYYGRVGFKTIPKGQASMPGPVDYNRLLVAELVDGTGINLPRIVPVRAASVFRGDGWMGVKMRDASVVRGVGVLPLFAGLIGLLLLLGAFAATWLREGR